MSAKILAFEGSGRNNSMNRQLLKQCVAGVEKAGGSVTLIDLHDYDLPIYNGDLEAEHGLPDNVVKLKKLAGECDGFLIATPEFNGGYSPLLKNAIDWMTRPSQQAAVPAQPFYGKIAGLLSTSPGPLSGLRGIYQLNTILFGIGVTVLSDIVAIGNYATAFNDDGTLKEDKHQQLIDKLAQRLIKFTA